MHITVLGGGIGGLTAALLLGRRGHQVTVLERDIRQAGADLDADFFDWQRPGVPQAIQPHGLLAPVRSILLAEAPDVYGAMLRLGARERHEFDWFDAARRTGPGTRSWSPSGAAGSSWRARCAKQPTGNQK